MIVTYTNFLIEFSIGTYVMHSGHETATKWGGIENLAAWNGEKNGTHYSRAERARDRGLGKRRRRRSRNLTNAEFWGGRAQGYGSPPPCTSPSCHCVNTIMTSYARCAVRYSNLPSSLWRHCGSERRGAVRRRGCATHLVNKQHTSAQQAHTKLGTAQLNTAQHSCTQPTGTA